MSRLCVGLLVLLLGVACSKSDNSDDGNNILGIPDKPVLTQAPSQPLNLTEYTQFKTFVANENSVHLFLPQTYVFAGGNQTGLTTDQKNLLASIRANCAVTNVSQKPDPSQPVGVGSVIVNTTTQKLEAGACPLNYSNDTNTTLTVIQAAQNAFATKGSVSFKEGLTILDTSVSPIIGTPQTSVNTSGTVMAQANSQEMRVRISLNSASSVFPLGTQSGHSESVGADVVVRSMQTGGSSLGIALNFTLNVPNMTKPIVISILVVISTPSSGGNSTVDAAEFYVNGSPIAGQDMNDIMNSQLMTSILNRIVGASQKLNEQLVSAAESIEIQ